MFVAHHHHSNDDAGSLSRWWHSWFGRRMLFELVGVLGAFVLYKVVRMAAQDEFDQAFRNASHVVAIERRLGIFNEVSMQRLVLHNPDLARVANRYYESAHLPATGFCLLWLYARDPRGYLETRRVLVISSVAAMAIHVVYPLAPPRMLPSLGFVDTGNTFGPATYGATGFFNSVANQIAAMPSLHFGWALLVAIAVIRYGRLRIRWIAALHPALTLLVIVVTANHYWLDGIVAALLVALAFGVLALVRRSSSARADTVIDLTTQPDRTSEPGHVALARDDKVRTSAAIARPAAARSVD
jgi:hypothetical protein